VAVRAANQPPPLLQANAVAGNVQLLEAVRREGRGWAEERLRAFGEELGGETQEWARLANEHPPVLRTHDRTGERIDRVEFHPAWHRLLELGVRHGLHAGSWLDDRPGAHVARAAAFAALAEVEQGVGCPLSMTHAAVPALRLEPALAATWEPLLTSLRYDPAEAPAREKRGALCGMSMTERQGGSDVRLNETQARPCGDGEATLHGHKWFCSAPLSDAFLMLAQAPGGLTCFLVPRVLPDGGRNAIGIDRLKDKLGNRSNASAEIRLEGAWAQRVGEGVAAFRRSSRWWSTRGSTACSARPR
jgi:putative acyl-CoA dehydrogenase